MSEIVQVLTPTVFGTGDGVKTVFDVTDLQADLIYVSSVMREDWQGNVALSAAPRTNIIRSSSEADAAVWTKNMSTVLANAIVAPDGTMTAEKVVENTAAGQHGNQQTVAPASLQPSTWYAWSRFYKAGERNFVWSTVGTFASQSQTTGVFLNLTTGQITGSGVARATVQQYPNGWWKLTVTCQTNAAPGNLTPGSFIAESQTSNSYTGDGTSGVYVWGAQFERLAATGPSTPYVATGASPVTVTDYVAVQPDKISMGQVPRAGAVLRWTGQYNYTPVAPPEPPDPPEPPPPLNPEIPRSLVPLVSPFSHGGPGGALRTEVAGGLPRYGLDYDRGAQQYQVTILLDKLRYSVWQVFFQRVIALGTLTFTMELDSGFGCQPHLVNIVPGTYNLSVTGGGSHRLATFTVEAESPVYDLTDAEVDALLEYYDRFGSDRTLIDRIAQFANVDTLVLNF